MAPSNLASANLRCLVRSTICRTAPGSGSGVYSRAPGARECPPGGAGWPECPAVDTVATGDGVSAEAVPAVTVAAPSSTAATMAVRDRKRGAIATPDIEQHRRAATRQWVAWPGIGERPKLSAGD